MGVSKLGILQKSLTSYESRKITINSAATWIQWPPWPPFLRHRHAMIHSLDHQIPHERSTLQIPLQLGCSAALRRRVVPQPQPQPPQPQLGQSLRSTPAWYPKVKTSLGKPSWRKKQSNKTSIFLGGCLSILRFRHQLIGEFLWIKLWLGMT